MMTDTPEGVTEQEDIDRARGCSDMALTYVLLERVHRYNPDEAPDTARMLYRIFCNIIGRKPDSFMEELAVVSYENTRQEFI